MRPGDAGYRPPVSAPEAIGSAPAASEAASSYAVLPQNTENELTLSEVHSHLDRALRFLQQDVGYALLDDARPRAGAGVRLRNSSRAAGEPPAVGRLPWSCKIPQELSTASGSGTRAEPPADLDSNVMELLHETFKRNGGKLRASELAEQLAKVCQWQSQSASRLNGQWDRLFSGGISDQDMEIGWEDFQSFYGEIPKAPSGVLGILEMSPEVARHAHYKCDLVMISRFAQLLYKSALQDSPPGSDKDEIERRVSKAVKHDVLYTNCLLAVRLLHLCNYDYADVVLVLAYASVYFGNTFNSIGTEMSPTESAHVVVLLIFLAHVFLLDETCPLRIWQKHIFRQYCTLKVLNAALLRVFAMRPGWSLRITDEEESMALLGLSGLRYSLQEGSEEERVATLGLSGSRGSLQEVSEEEDVSDSPELATATLNPITSPVNPINIPSEKKGEVANDQVISPGHCTNTTTDESD